MVHSLYIDPQHLTARLCRIRSIAVDDYPHFNIDTAFLQENLALQADFMFLIIAAYRQEKYKQFGPEHFAEASRQAVMDMVADINSVL